MDQAILKVGLVAARAGWARRAAKHRALSNRRWQALIMTFPLTLTTDKVQEVGGEKGSRFGLPGFYPAV